MKNNFLTLFALMFLFFACTPNTIVAVPTDIIKVTDNPTVTAIVIRESVPTSELEISEEQVLGELCQSAGYQGLVNFYPNVYYSPTRKWVFTSCENVSDGTRSYPFIISHVLENQIFKPITLPSDSVSKSSSSVYKPIYWNDGESVLIVSALDIPCPDSILCLYEDGKALSVIDLDRHDVSNIVAPSNIFICFLYFT